MINLEVVGSSPRANLLSRLGLLDSRGDGGRAGSPSVVYSSSSHPSPRDASIIHIPSARRKRGSRRAVQKAATSHQQQHNAPLPEAVDEDLPADYIASVNHAIASYNRHTTPASSGRSSPALMEGRGAMAVSQEGWTTGNTTERSSVDSSCYSLDRQCQGTTVKQQNSAHGFSGSDGLLSSSNGSISMTEFDRQAASTVNRHFEEFESMLFEGPKETGSSVYRECQEWVTQFPHLRVLGQQLMAPADLGYNFVASNSTLGIERSSTSGTFDLSIPEHDLSAASDVQGLTLSGRKVKATVAPLSVSSKASLQAEGHSRNSNHSSSDLSFLHEEIFAQDGVYEDIIAVDYKDIYEENMEHKKQITPRRRHVGYPPITPNASVKDSVLSGAFDQMWSEIMSWLRSLLKKYSLELEAKKSSSTLEHILGPQRPVRASSFVLTPRDAHDGMLPLLQVSKMALRDRNSHSLSSVDMGDPAVVGESSQAAFLSAQQMMASRPSTIHHPRRRPSHSQHLDPLPEPSKMFSAEEGHASQPSPQYALRGKQIVPASPHRLSSPPSSIPGRLPPLESSFGMPSRHKFGHRASSAIDNKEGRKHGGRERNNSSSEVSRPSTTQAFRSDPPFVAHNLRSSTPMVQSIPGRQVCVMGGSGGGLNVMGNGLYPSADPAPSGLDDQEGASLDRHTQWMPSAPSFSFFKPRRTLRN